MAIKRGRRGISPVIATILLICLTLLAALAIFMWAKGFVGEKNVKLGREIELYCPETNFAVEAKKDNVNSEIIVNIENKGQIPFYGISINLKSLGTIKKLGLFEKLVMGGMSESVTIDDSTIFNEISVGDELIIIPAILGKKGEVGEPYICEDYGKTILVG